MELPMAICPLMNNNVNAMRAQINVAVQHYEKHFGRKPRGIWLPECAYEPGIDQLLKDAGIRFYCRNAWNSLRLSKAEIWQLCPIYCPTGVAAFSRDMESSSRFGVQGRLPRVIFPIVIFIAT